MYNVMNPTEKMPTLCNWRRADSNTKKMMLRMQMMVSTR